MGSLRASRPAQVETLENRRLLSGVVAHPGHLAPGLVGIPVQGTLVTLTGRHLPADSNQYQSVVDWGDGTPPQTFSGAGLQVSRKAFIAFPHTYAQPGVYHITEKATVAGKRLHPIHERIRIGAAPPAQSKELAVVAGQRFEGVIGTFTSTAAPNDITINWGDGTLSPGTWVTLDQYTYQVTGAHVYTNAGTYKITVELGSHPLPGTFIPDVVVPSPIIQPLASTITVTGNPVTPTKPHVRAIGLNADAYASQYTPIAKLTGLNVDKYTPQVYANVDWGNGHTPAYWGQPVTSEPNGDQVATYYHTFNVGTGGADVPMSGTYTVKVTFLLNDHFDGRQNTVLASTQTTINIRRNSPTGVTLHLSHGAAFTESLGTFTAPAGKQPTSTIVYWGDQFSDSGPATAVPQGNGVYQVTGAHTYSRLGTFAITIVADFGRLPSGQEDVAVVYSSADVT